MPKPPIDFDAIHIVALSRHVPSRNIVRVVANLVTRINKHYTWNAVNAGVWGEFVKAPTADNPDAGTRTRRISQSVKNIIELRKLLRAVHPLESVVVSSPRRGSVRRGIDVEWGLHVDWQRDRTTLPTNGAWYAPYETVLCITLRCSKAMRECAHGDRVKLCLKLLSEANDGLDPYFSVITCESLEDTKNGDFYLSGVVEPCTNFRREAMSYWATFPDEERRRRVPAVFWGNYYSGELLEAVQKKCPTFFEQIAKWKIAFPEETDVQHSSHIVRKMGPGMFWTLSEDPLHDSRSEFGSGTSYGGRFLELNMFARRLLSEAGIHI